MVNKETCTFCGSPNRYFQFTKDEKIDSKVLKSAEDELAKLVILLMGSEKQELKPERQESQRKEVSQLVSELDNLTIL